MEKVSFFAWRQRYSDKIFDFFNVCIMLVLLVIFAWPIWFVLIASFSNPGLVAAGDVLLIPKKITLESYKTMLEYKEIWIGYANSIFYTVVGTILNLIMSVCFAYPLSSKDFLPRKFFIMIFLFTMYFSGGLIPLYLVVKSVGLLDTRWAMIIPTVVSVYNCLVIRNYFMSSIPGELKEAAFLDGANSAQYLWKVVLPLSKPVLAVVGLYYAVSHWNDYYQALIYLFDNNKVPLQTVLRKLLMSTKFMMNNADFVDAEAVKAATEQALTMKYGVIVVAALPMLILYPFIQKFFVKGVMIGAVKG